MVLPSWVQDGRAKVLRRPGRTRTYLVYAVIALVVVGFLGKGFLFRDAPNSGWVVPSDLFYPLTKSIEFADKLPQPPQPLSQYPAPLKPKNRSMLVPNAVHYVYGLKPVPEGGQPDELPYYAYLAMRSALLNLKPDKIYFHYQSLPRGPWWDLIAPHLTLIKTAVPTEIYGHELDHFAHRADVVRLWVMKQSGGIYLDIDMFVLRSFDDLLYAPTTMGMESATDWSRSQYDPTGLCNGVIISQPGAPFIDHWMKSYVNFDKGVWAGHSVDKPWDLARKFPNEIQVLNRKAFFWPHWRGSEVEDVHQKDEYDFYGTGQYAYHAWESLAMRFLEKLSPDSIRTEDTSFHRLVRPLIGPEDDRVFKTWKPSH